MGIRFLCPACGKKVHVKDHQAGLRGFCPKCRAKIDIPRHSTLPGNRDRQRYESAAQPIAGAAGEETIAALLPHVGRLLAVREQPPVDPLAEVTGAQWYVVPPDGTEPFGPADSRTIGLWMQQGRIVGRSLVWRDDWSAWRKAGTVWSQLALKEVDSHGQRAVGRARSAVPQFTAPAVPQAAAPQAAALPQAVPVTGSQAGLPTAVPAALPPAIPAAAAASTGPADAELYYPRRSNALYLSVVALLLLGLVALSVVLFYVLDRIQQQKQRPAQPPAGGVQRQDLPSSVHAVKPPATARG